MTVHRKIVSQQLTTCDVIDQGEGVRLNLVNQGGHSVSLEMTVEQAQSIVMTLPQLLSEAVKARANAVVAPIGTGWASGWTVKVGSATYAQTDALRSGIGVQVGVPASSATAITYGYNGRLTGTAQQLIFYSTKETSKVRSRCVSVDTNGLPRVRIDSDTDPTNGC